MNKQRRQAIAEIITKVQEAAELLTAIKDDVDTIKDEETEYYDNMPEGLQMSERGIKAEEAVGQLDSAMYELENIDFDSLVSSLEAAAE